MERDFTVRSHRDGTVDTTPDMETIISNMGCNSFNNRALGSVVVIVEKVKGTITKEKIKWREGNDPIFNESQAKDANTLLALATRQVNGGGEDGEIRIKIVAKL